LGESNLGFAALQLALLALATPQAQVVFVSHAIGMDKDSEVSFRSNPILSSSVL
jgi:hypothetical protein